MSDGIYKGLPLGRIENYSSQRNEAIIIVVLQAFGNDDSYHAPDLFAQTIQKYTHKNILYLNYSGQDVSLDQFKEEIREFANKHNKVSFISNAHGFKVLPWRGHETAFGKVELETTPLFNYFTDNIFISSAQYLQTIAEATQGTELEILLNTCQGNQLAEIARNVFKPGTKIYTQSDGFVMDSIGLVVSMVVTLTSIYRQPDDILSDILSYVLEHRNTNYQYNYNPLLTIASGYTIAINEQANLLLGKATLHFKNGTFDSWVKEVQNNYPNITKDFFKFFEQFVVKHAHEKIDLKQCFTGFGLNSYIIEIAKEYFKKIFPDVFYDKEDYSLFQERQQSASTKDGLSLLNQVSSFFDEVLNPWECKLSSKEYGQLMGAAIKISAEEFDF